MTGMTPSLVENSPIHSCIADIYKQYYPVNSGNVADYIPELAKVNADYFGVCIATADGQIYEMGESAEPFTIQSISKAFVYGLALADRGREAVMRKVGVEPTGEAFNSIIFDEQNNRPYNPMVNAGAIATTALIKGNGYEERFARILQLFERFTGRPLSVDEAVFQSERATGHRNRAIAYLELNAGMLDQPIDEHLDLYFRQCSILVTARDLAVMAATLANNGVNPITGERAIGAEQVTSILSVMGSCGMYDFSGEWIYRIGLPAKSGVGGGIIAVLPGQFGVGTFSPRLDERGNSVRGIRVCEELSNRFRLHLFETHVTAGSIVRRTYTGAAASSKRNRRASEQAIIDRYTAKIVVYELQGDLYFATMEQLVRRIQADLSQLTFLILDGRRIGRANETALTLLYEIQQWLANRQERVVLAGFPSVINTVLKKRGWSETALFEDTDAALEWCENHLLAAVGHKREEDSAPLALAEIDILSSFSADECEVIASLVTEVHYQPDDSIIHEGEEADRLFLLSAGTATVSIKLAEDDRIKRLTTFMPGVTFGELALFDGGKRTADVIADNATVCYVLPLARFESLAATAPGLHAKLLRAVGKNLVNSLRRTTAEVRSLEA
jgi:glutaminase